MAKSVHADVLDGALAVVSTHASKMVALASQPATFAAATSGALAGVAMAPADFALAAGVVSGRRLTVAAKSAVAVSASGSATHVALLDETLSRLLYVTTCPATALTAGGTVNFGAWAIELADPA